MTIALFSDIHSNFPALEAMFEDMGRHRIDSTYCLGDLVGYNIWPNEVTDLIRQKQIPTIAGNYDFGVGRNSDDCGCAYKTEEERALGARSITFTNAMIGADERAYLRSLPFSIRIEFPGAADNRALLLVHGSPRKINEYLFEDRAESSMSRILQDAKADILCFGHTHKPYYRLLRATRESGESMLHAINIGSVGKPKDGDPRGCYVLLHLDEDQSQLNSVSIRVEFIRFAYDVERAAAAIEASPLPNEYADMLRMGY